MMYFADASRSTKLPRSPSISTASEEDQECRPAMSDACAGESHVVEPVEIIQLCVRETDHGCTVPDACRREVKCRKSSADRNRTSRCKGSQGSVLWGWRSMTSNSFHEWCHGEPSAISPVIA
jgi:hypothetical protein